MPTMLTVKEAVKRAKADGFPISEYTLRRWLKTGEIPYRTPGTKILLYYPHLLAYLKCETTAESTSVADVIIAVDGVRKDA